MSSLGSTSSGETSQENPKSSNRYHSSKESQDGRRVDSREMLVDSIVKKAEKSAPYTIVKKQAAGESISTTKLARGFGARYDA